MKNLLIEGVRDKALERFMPLLQKRGINVSISQLKNALLTKFVNEANIHSLSLHSNFYLLGVAIYYFNGNLTTNKMINILYPRVKDKFIPEICNRLDKLIEMLRNSYIDSVGTQWELTEDFGNLPLDKLLKKYNSKINKALGIDVKPKKVSEQPSVSDDYTAGQYTYEILYSYEDATKYKEATSPGAWCITYGQQHYKGYISRLNIHYVVFARQGYEKVKRQVGKGYTKQKPHDEYGNSLICVLQSNSSPQPIFITSRWNHGSTLDGTNGTEADHAYTTDEFLNVIGCDYSVLERAYEQWKTNKPKQNSFDRSKAYENKLNALRHIKYIQMLLNGGASVKEVYDRYNSMEGFGLSFSCFDEDSKNDSKINGTYFLRLKCGEEEWTTVMDRKKIFFEDLFINKRVWYNIKDHNNFYTLYSYSDPIYIFDKRRHQFFNIEGVNKFKAVSNGFENDLYNETYGIVVANGTQAALVKLDTLKPVRTPQGHVWFEYIGKSFSMNSDMLTYSRHIHIDYNISKYKLIHLVYDSSANEDYYFNTVTNSFSDIISNLPQVVSALDVEGDLNYDYIKCRSHLNDKFFYKNIFDGSLFDVGDGNPYFDWLTGENNIIVYQHSSNSDVYVYDNNIKQHITINGEPIKLKNFTNPESFNIREPYIYKLQYNVERYNKFFPHNTYPYTNYTYNNNDTNPYISQNYLYNSQTHKLLHDENGNYLFYMKYNNFLDKYGYKYEPKLLENRMNRIQSIIREELFRVL